MGRVASPSMLSKLVLRSPLTHLLGKRQRRLLPSFAACSQVSLMPAALPSRATALVLKYCPPEDLARLAVTNAAWACRLVEHAATEETWAAWAAMTPRPTLQHMQQLCAACTLRLPPSQTIEGLRAMEVSDAPRPQCRLPRSRTHARPAERKRHAHARAPATASNRSAVGAQRVRCQGHQAVRLVARRRLGRLAARDPRRRRVRPPAAPRARPLPPTHTHRRTRPPAPPTTAHHLPPAPPERRAARSTHSAHTPPPRRAHPARSRAPPGLVSSLCSPMTQCTPHIDLTPTCVPALPLLYSCLCSTLLYPCSTPASSTLASARGPVGLRCSAPATRPTMRRSST